MKIEELDAIKISEENEVAREKVEFGEAHKRLLNNPDYQLVISKGYFEDFAKETAVAIAKNTGAYDADELVKDLMGINVLKKYEFKVAAMYSDALKTLEDNSAYLANAEEE